MTDSTIEARIAAAAESAKADKKKKKRSKTPSLRQRLLGISRKSSGSSTDTASTCRSASRRGSLRSLSSETIKTMKSLRSSTPGKKRQSKVRFGSNMIYPAVEDYHGLSRDNIWWSADSLEARRVSDYNAFMKKAAVKNFLKQCESSRTLLENELLALQPEDTKSSGTASTESSSCDAPQSADLDPEDEILLSDGELLRFLSEHIEYGLKKGYRGMEGGCLSRRYDHTQKVTQAILNHIEQAKKEKKKRNKEARKEQKEQQQAALAAFSLQATRAHRQWARVLAMGDRKAFRGKKIVVPLVSTGSP